MRAVTFFTTLFISLPLTALALSLALSNRDQAALRLWPFDGVWTVEAGWIFASILGAGFLAGAFFVTVLMQPVRYRLWQVTRRLQRLEKDLAAAEQKPAQSSGDASPQLTVQSALQDVESAPLRF